MIKQGGPANTTRTRQQPANRSAGRTIRLFFAVLAVFGGLLVSNVLSNSQSSQYKEYEVKAAFIYNFLKFVDWPEKKMADNKKQIVIGIIGENPFGPAADVFKNKKVEERDVVLKYFPGLEQIKKLSEMERIESETSIKNCHLLFICPSEHKQLSEISNIVDKNGVLTVGDTDGFTKAGVTINFLMEDNKIRFNVNLTSAEKSGLKIRSQLLRLAKKVYKDDAEVTGAHNSSAEGEAK